MQNGVKHLHLLNPYEAKVLSSFALSGTARKKVIPNFVHSIRI